MCSRLREHNVLAPETIFYWYPNRDEGFVQYFTWDEELFLVYCNDVGELLKGSGIQYVATEWSLFLDSSVKRMKAVPLHISNTVIN